MNGWEIAKNVLLLLAGLGAMMFGMQVLSDNLTKASGKKMRVALSRLSSNRFKGIVVGGAVSAVIHSSAATTVMVVGLVNSGILSLFQAASIIMGANIGTTVTGLMLSLQSLPITEIFAALAFIGIAMLLFCKKPFVKVISYILIGFGLLFVGMNVMKVSMNLIIEGAPGINDLFWKVKNPFLLLLLGAALTAIMQSSTTMTAILIVLATSGIETGGAGLIDLQSAIYVVLGMNLGTCATSLIASIGANTNSVRAAMFHLMFNLFGTLIFFCLLFIAPLRSWLIDCVLFGDDVSKIAYSIAIFHAVFNLTTTTLLVPFITPLVKLVSKIVPEKKSKNEDDQLHLRYIDERFLANSAIAVGECKREICYMAERAYKNYLLSMDSIIAVDLSKKDEFDRREAKINFLNREIAKYLVRVSSMNISDEDEQIIATYYHVITDLERVGDYAENIMEYTQRLSDDGSKFSPAAIDELKEIVNAISNLYLSTVQAFNTQDLNALLQAEIYEDSVDEMKEKLSAAHIERLENKECTVENGAVFLSLLNDLERIADHFFNVAKSIKEYTQGIVVQTENVVIKN
ncbi:MAG: Na/Pi cotransporter family protein [Clostridia bacterium]|nr:Na/Pi cotransporter family protein [Clostridia bacterium]